MQFFRHGRRNKQIEQILAISHNYVAVRDGVTEVTLQGLSDDHLADLASIVNRMKDDAGRRNCGAVLRELAADAKQTRELRQAKDAVARLREMAERKQQRENAARQLRDLATGLFTQMAPAINAQLPVGCRADAEKCLPVIESLMTEGKEPEKLIAGFAAALRKNPAAFVDHPDVYYGHRAAEVFTQIEPRLMESLPTGARLKPAECKNLLKSLMADGTSDERLIDAFMSRLQNDSAQYLSGVTLQSPRDIAEKVYAQIEFQFISSLPLGCTADRSACISALESLVKSHTPPEKLVEAFMKMIAAGPTLYLNMPTPQFRPSSYSSYPSSAPVSMGRSELRS